MFCYSIKTKRNLALGTQFINGAAIYFDYNAPVMTNKTLNTLGDASVGIQNIDRLQTNELVLYPNPTNGIVTLSSPYVMKSIEVYNVAGALLFLTPGSEKTQQLSLHNFSDGIYFIKVSYADGLSITKKVVVNR
jgi:hypothetical protein